MDKFKALGGNWNTSERLWIIQEDVDISEIEDQISMYEVWDERTV